YGGTSVYFIKDDTSLFGMFTPQEGTTCVINGDNVVIHFVPKNTTVYGALHFGAITDEALTADVTFNADGSFDITLPKNDHCGKAVPVAPVKKSDGGTTSAQYYLAVPAANLLQDVTSSVTAAFDYAGSDVCFINAEGTGFGMFTAQEGTTCVINGDNAVIHFVPKNTTVYGALHFGAITDAALTADVTFNADGSFDITLPKASYCGKAVPVAPVKKTDGGTTSAQYYLAVPAANLLQDVTNVDTPADYSALDAALASVPADLSVYTDSSVQALNSAVGAVVRDLKAPDQARVDAMARAVSSAVAGLKLKSSGTGSGTGSGGGSDKDTDESTELSVTNNTGMFKVVTALLETKNGRTELIVTLSGSTYHELFKGNYAQAVANGNDRSKWIHGYTNDDGKWEFRIPVSSGESYIPCVSISSTYLNSFEAGENPVERAFYPRQFEIDRAAKTLTVGDYDETVTVSVTSSSKSFRVSSSARMRVVGGPNSNNYNIAPTLKMLDDTYDRLTYPTVVDGSVGEATAELSSGKSFSISLLNAPTKTAFMDREPVTIKLRRKSDGSIVTFEMTIDLLAKTISITGGDGDDESDGSGKDVSSGEGDAAQTSDNSAGARLTAETVDGAAHASVSAEDIAEAVGTGENTDTLIFDVQSTAEADTVSLGLSADALKTAAERGLAVTVSTAAGAVKLSGADVSALAETDSDTTVSVKTGEDGTVTLDVTSAGKSADISIKAELPEAAENDVLVIVREDGSEEIIKKCVVEDGKMYALVPAGATVRSVSASKSFNDVTDGSWYGGAVSFASGRGLFLGTSDSEFSPDLPMTRAMLVTVLYRLENEPETAGEALFSDVKEDGWYAEAVAWAAENGIVKGISSDSFGTNDNVTREQIATMLYRYAGYIGMDVSAEGDLTGYPDGAEISSWARDAMSWAVGAGLFKGDDTGALRPGDDASRAEVAELIMRMVALMTK
nr:S-layer homology domain-containing protein [Oscillospiraceae bacterium]